MSLNGLDDTRVKEAHETAVAEPGGWYVSTRHCFLLPLAAVVQLDRPSHEAHMVLYSKPGLILVFKTGSSSSMPLVTRSSCWVEATAASSRFATTSPSTRRSRRFTASSGIGAAMSSSNTCPRTVPG